MTTSPDYNIVIAGGGMVGASLALLLSHHSEEQLKILIVESAALPQKNKKSLFQPSFDARSTALTYGSRLLLESLGIWSQLAERIACIDSIHVGEQGRFGSALMSRDDTDWPSLGYVVENAWLGETLLGTLHKNNNIHFYHSASVSSISVQRGGAVIKINNDQQKVETITTQLAVVADGANSGLRRQLGIVASTNNYNQTALIANVSFTKAHNNRAYERFTHQGPMALLPLTDCEHGLARSALVWTMPADQAKMLLLCEEREFLQQLQKRFGHRQGEFIRAGQRACYPLMMVQAEEQVRSNIVVMGNAAHSLHPVAGQGFNLALRDCARLAMVTTTSLNNGAGLGSLSSLNDYLTQQQFDQKKTVTLSDYLPAIFGSRLWGVSFLRTLGLATLDVIPIAKKQFIYHAEGLHDGAALSHH